ncbi:MAG: TolB family protein [bacterium]
MKAKRILTQLYVCLIFTSIISAQGIPDGSYFGQDPPGLTPEVFAPGIISIENRYEYIVTFSPGLNECVFGITDSTWNYFTLMFTKKAEDGSWIEPIPAPFMGIGDGFLPAYSQDGDKIFFISSRRSYPPTNIWYSERDNSLWNEPIVLPAPVNTESDEFGLSLTIDKKLYFTSNRNGGYGQQDIYRSKLVNSQYSSVENIGPPINTPYNEASPFIAPDGSYLIFESNRPGGYGQVDLYISFFKDSIWTEPENLGPKINTDQIDDAGYVSPDGKYFFFNRREGWVTNVPTDIYWVDIRAIFPDLTSRNK